MSFYIVPFLGIRLFNNLALPLRSKEDCEEYTVAIFEQIYNAIDLAGLLKNVNISRNSVLDAKNFKPPPVSVNFQMPKNDSSVKLVNVNGKLLNDNFQDSNAGILFTTCNNVNLTVPDGQLTNAKRSGSFTIGWNNNHESNDDFAVKFTVEMGIDQNLKIDSKSPVSTAENRQSDNDCKLKASPSAQLLNKFYAGGRYLKSIVDKQKELKAEVGDVAKNRGGNLTQGEVFGKFRNRINKSKSRFVIL